MSRVAFPSRGAKGRERDLSFVFESYENARSIVCICISVFVYMYYMCVCVCARFFSSQVFSGLLFYGEEVLAVSVWFSV